MGIKAKDFFESPVNMENLVSVSVDGKPVELWDKIDTPVKRDPPYHICRYCDVVALETDMEEVNEKWYCLECKDKAE